MVMKDEKLKKLFELARTEIPPDAPEGFDTGVIRAVRNETRLVVSWWEQIGELFPRLALATALVLGLCVAGEVYFSTEYSTSLTADVGAISEQWLFAANAN